jgi:hypothetical protein
MPGAAASLIGAASVARGFCQLTMEKSAFSDLDERSREIFRTIVELI